MTDPRFISPSDRERIVHLLEKMKGDENGDGAWPISEALIEIDKLFEGEQYPQSTSSCGVKDCTGIHEPTDPPRGELCPLIRQAATIISPVLWGDAYRPGRGPMHHAGGSYWREELLRNASRWNRLAAAALICAEVLPRESELCDHCNGELSRGACLVCGAPVCCSRCCAETTAELQSEADDG